MNFKEYVTKDITGAFVNLDEFAMPIAINGETVNVVEDSDRLEYRIKTNYNGLVIGDVLFYISEDEYLKIPHVNQIPTADQIISYGGTPMTIVNVGKQMGMYEIILRNAGGY